ncbi:hypothetical protein [Nocardiopsis sp. MG754419]|uniref:hypothetical protein n=1 Tax=Nocardiopsis sp. MG754419 TaxID=2259865 RepID=UPI001BA4D41B|nr:hypothetical protein [Nocardiopsis sp. MG754419]MBR8743545.1 hypothetical protein [Nocardiopsis sp. MG754419]
MLRTTPARVWLLSLLCVATIVGLFGSASLTLDRARDGLHVLGRDAGPQAMATTELYLALADMDARVADLLLMGTDHDLGSGREEAVTGYEHSRGRANEALLQAASLTEGDTVEERNVQAVLDGIGTYEGLAAEARLLNDEAAAPPGEVDPGALETYRQATRLMHTELLPKAFNLGLDSSAIVRANHDEGRSSVALGLVWVGGVGAATVASLIALQLYLRVRFRRRFNAPLLAATLVAAALTIGVTVALDTSGGHQSEAKDEGLDAAMASARAGAITTDAQADQSRYLIDDVFADNYQQVYLERSQQVLFRPASTLDEYYERVAEVPETFPVLPGSDGSDPDDPGTLGYLGQSAQTALATGREDALAEVLSAYNALQVEDRALRAAAEEGDLDTAIDVRMGVAHAEEGAFAAYRDALDALIDLHREEFTAGIDRGDAALEPWTRALPVGTLLLLALVVVGVRPRLAEYR